MARLILEQYEHFVKSNRALIEEDPIGFIKNESSFKDYVEALSEAIEEPEAFRKVAYRERDVILEAAGDVEGSEGRAWAILYFPILAEVYQTPLISKLLTVFTTSEKRVVIPRKVVFGEIIDLDGTVKSTVELPSSQAVRPDLKTLDVPEGKTNIFTSLSIPSGVKAKINQRYFAITKVKLTDEGNPVTIDTVIRPDFSGNFSGVVTFKASGDSKDVTVYINGNVNFETGDIVVTKTIQTDSSDSITFNSVTVETRINVYGKDLGKVKATLKVKDEIKLQLDEDNSFFVELIDEQIQDFKDIYNLDLLASIIEVVKLQFALNKDADVTSLLKLSEPDMNAYGNTASINFGSLPSYLNPANISDVYSLVVPKILAVANNIEKVAHVTPQFLVASRKMATVLETLQSWVSSQMNTQGEGRIGPVASALQYSRFQVLKSDTVDDDKIYVVYKANVRSAAALIDIVYKPIYVHKSDVDGVAKQYIKTRTAVVVADPRKVGVVTVQNII